VSRGGRRSASRRTPRQLLDGAPDAADLSSTRTRRRGDRDGRRRRLRSTVRALAGLYLWSDLCDGRIYGFSAGAARPEPSPLGVAVTQPTSFGTDGSGRVYVTTATGSLYRLDLRGGDGAGAR